jgi:hypothetical protein
VVQKYEESNIISASWSDSDAALAKWEAQRDYLPTGRTHPLLGLIRKCRIAFKRSFDAGLASHFAASRKTGARSPKTDVASGLTGRMACIERFSLTLVLLSARFLRIIERRRNAKSADPVIEVHAGCRADRRNPNKTRVTMKAIVSAALRAACPTIFTALVAAASLAPVSVWAGTPSPTSTETKAAASASTAPATSGDKWRFVWHNDQWWYYMPKGKWVVHDGSDWHLPKTAVPTRVPTAQVYQPAPAYRNQPNPRSRQFMGSGRNGKGMDNDGMWGNSSRYWTYQHVLKSQ